MVLAFAADSTMTTFISSFLLLGKNEPLAGSYVYATRLE
jgi:hypothetical protein